MLREGFIATISSGWVRWTCKKKYSLDIAVSDKCYHFYGNPSNLILVTFCCFNPPVPSGHSSGQRIMLPLGIK